MLSSARLQKFLDDYVDGDGGRAGELLAFVPNIVEGLRSLDSTNDWIHWTEGTHDGWYLVSSGEKARVFFQERGLKQQSFVGSEGDAFIYLVRELWPKNVG